MHAPLQHWSPEAQTLPSMHGPPPLSPDGASEPGAPSLSDVASLPDVSSATPSEDESLPDPESTLPPLEDSDPPHATNVAATPRMRTSRIGSPRTHEPCRAQSHLQSGHPTGHVGPG
jgi:hypothetical protein